MGVVHDHEGPECKTETPGEKGCYFISHLVPLLAYVPDSIGIIHAKIKSLFRPAEITTAYLLPMTNPID